MTGIALHIVPYVVVACVRSLGDTRRVTASGRRAGADGVLQRSTSSRSGIDQGLCRTGIGGRLGRWCSCERGSGLAADGYGIGGGRHGVAVVVAVGDGGGNRCRTCR